MCGCWNLCPCILCSTSVLHISSCTDEIKQQLAQYPIGSNEYYQKLLEYAIAIMDQQGRLTGDQETPGQNYMNK